jgi:hypothetical protein
MVTPELEKLILAGKADYFTYAVGGSGVATLPFPKHARTMIVVDFVWYPFYDSDIFLSVSPFQISQDNIHTMKFFNGRRTSVINFRDQFSLHRYTQPSPIPTSDQLQIANTPQFFSPYQHHCYIVSDQDIQIDIYKYTPSGSITRTVDFIPLESPTNEPARPNGYGGVFAVRIFNTGEAPVISLTADRDPVGAATAVALATVGPRSRNEFFADISDTNRLIPPPELDALSSCYRFPMVNFGIVVINENVDVLGI